MECSLCLAEHEEVIWRDGGCRVVLVDDADYPGFSRVIWHEHVVEMSDLTAADQRHLLNVVLATETALRSLMRPDKINLASLGNVVPHLHWHVIPRFRDDRHFPQPIWGSPQREPTRRQPPRADALRAAVVTALTELTAG